MSGILEAKDYIEKIALQPTFTGFFNPKSMISKSGIQRTPAKLTTTSKSITSVKPPRNYSSATNKSGLHNADLNRGAGQNKYSS